MLSKYLSAVLLFNVAAFASLHSAVSAAALPLKGQHPSRVSTIKKSLHKGTPKNLLPASLGANSAITVIPNAIDDIDLDEIRASFKDASFSPGLNEQKSVSHMELNPSVSARFRELLGGLPVGGNEMTKFMMIKDYPTPLHADTKLDAATNQYIPMTSNDRSALFVVDVVGDAQFRHADVSVPLATGMFIHFRGDLQHHTHLNKGSAVTYLGPFYVNEFAKVERSLSGVDCPPSNSKGAYMWSSLKGPLKSRVNRRQLEEGASDNNTASGLEGEVVMGNFFITTNKDFASNFLATDVTGGLPKDCVECAVNVAITQSDECSIEAHDKAMIVPLDQPIIYSTDEFGSTQGWQEQAVYEHQLDTNSTQPISLEELIDQAGSMEMADPEASTDYHVAVYFYDQNGELVACSSLQALDEDTAAEYDKQLNDGCNGAAAAPMDTTSESNGMFMSAITIAAVGISLVLGSALTL